MEALGYRLALALVLIAALGRSTGIFLLKLRQARYARRALAYPRSWRDLCTVPEPYPLYLAAFGIWLALALAFASPVALGLTLLYVIPSYLIYLRAEEDMLLSRLGEPYRRYRSEVGMLLPRRGGPR